MNTRNSFIDRGGAWVLGQTVLMVAVLSLGPLGSGQWSGRMVQVAGGLLCAVGAAFGLAGVMVLGRNRTIFPRPRDDSVLIQRGVYGLVRHPLYTSVMSLSIGWTLCWGSASALVIAISLVILLDAKARREERWLREKFPGYRDYEMRVRRFVPWVY